MYKQRAVRVQNFRRLGNVLLEHAQRRRVRDHHRGHVAVYDFLQPRDIDLAALVRAHVFDFVSRDYRRRRIRSMRGVWDQDFLARAALRVRKIGANQQQSSQLALRARRRFERASIHARDFDEAVQQQLQNFQAALRDFLWLIGMLGGDSVEPRDKFVDARVVFHRAGPERIHPQVDRVVPRG